MRDLVSRSADPSEAQFVGGRHFVAALAAAEIFRVVGSQRRTTPAAVKDRRERDLLGLVWRWDPSRSQLRIEFYMIVDSEIRVVNKVTKFLLRIFLPGLGANLARQNCCSRNGRRINRDLRVYIRQAASMQIIRDGLA